MIDNLFSTPISYSEIPESFFAWLMVVSQAKMEGNGGGFRLPPGFRFSPTDEELILHFLSPKAASSACLSLSPCHRDLCNIIPIVPNALHLNPWELDGKAWSSDGRHYFYFSKYKKNNTNAPQYGYWKDLEMEEHIFERNNGLRVGNKKHLVFCSGNAPSAQETNWIMQEYHLCNSNTIENSVTETYNKQRKKANEQNSIFLCKVQERETNNEESLYCDDDDTTELSYMDEMYLSKDDDFDDITMPWD